MVVLRGGSMRDGTWCFRPGDVVVAVVWVNDMMRSRKTRAFGRSGRGCVVGEKKGER